MTARGTDWGLAALVASLIVTGALTLFAGGSADAWVYSLHDALSVALLVLVAVKLRRVWPRLRSRSRWERRTAPALAGTALVALTLAAGLLWATGITPAPAGYSLLAWHEALGAALGAAVVAHMLARARPMRMRQLSDRRQFLAAAGIAAASAIVWQAQRPLEAALRLRGASRRFTGSYDAGSFSGNAFPTTSWVADNPPSVALDGYRLAIGGLVAQPASLPLSELGTADELIATLDCTGGFYSTQRWRGMRLDRAIALAGAHSAAAHVSVISLTGYRWSFALADAPALLLATEVGGQPLSHGHGAPVRLVAPGARGYQWVKWVTRIELRSTPDYLAPASTVWSSL